jgi:hypothetical protein
LEEVIIIGEHTTVYCSTSEFRAVPIRLFITENYNQVDVDGFLYMLNDHIGLIHLFVFTYENEKGEHIGFNIEAYSTSEIDRIAQIAFGIAKKMAWETLLG